MKTSGDFTGWKREKRRTDEKERGNSDKIRGPTLSRRRPPRRRRERSEEKKTRQMNKETLAVAAKEKSGRSAPNAGAMRDRDERRPKRGTRNKNNLWMRAGIASGAPPARPPTSTEGRRRRASGSSVAAVPPTPASSFSLSFSFIHHSALSSLVSPFARVL